MRQRVEEFMRPHWVRFAKILRSAKLCVALLVLISISSAIGTFIPQNAPAENYVEACGETLYVLFVTTGLTHVYTAWWFIAFVALLCANIIACSLSRLPALRQMLSGPPRSPSGAKGKPLYAEEVVYPSSTGISAQSALDSAHATLRNRGYRTSTVSSGKEAHLFAEKGRWSKLGPLVVHVAVLTICLGGLITGLFARRETLVVGEGDQVVIPGSKDRLRLDRFEAAHYPGTKRPRSYTSTVSLLREGREAGGGEITVNGPLTLAGMTFYQTAYDAEPTDVSLTVKGKETKKSLGTFRIPIGQSVKLPGTDVEIRAARFLRDFAMAGGVKFSRSRQLNNPAVRIDVYEAGSRRSKTWEFAKYPGFHQSKDPAYSFAVTDVSTKKFSILKGVRDPGVPIAYLGFTLLVLGTCVGCYVFHYRLSVSVRSAPEGAVLRVEGRARRNRIGFKREFDRLVETLRVQPRRGPQPARPEAMFLHDDAESVME